MTPGPEWALLGTFLSGFEILSISILLPCLTGQRHFLLASLVHLRSFGVTDLFCRGRFGGSAACRYGSFANTSPNGSPRLRDPCWSPCSGTAGVSARGTRATSGRDSGFHWNGPFVGPGEGKFLAIPLSSTIPIASASACCLAISCWHWSRRLSSSQTIDSRNRWRVRGATP